MAYRLEELKNVKILKRDLNEKVLRYVHLEIKNITMAKNWVTFDSNFSFRPQAPENDPKIAEKQQNFERKFKFRSIKSYFFQDVRLNLRALLLL